MTFFGQWSEVQSEISSKAMEQMYCAPGKDMHDGPMKPPSLPPSGGTKQSTFTHGVKLHGNIHTSAEHFKRVQDELNSARMLTEIGGVSRVTEACDWWSLGALLFELLTGMVSEVSTSTSTQKSAMSVLFLHPSPKLWPRGRGPSRALLPVPAAAVAAPSSRNPFSHPAGHPQPPERRGCVSAHRGETEGVKCDARFLNS